MFVFGWTGEGEPPPHWDLRCAGWMLAAPVTPGRRIALVDARRGECAEPAAEPALCIVLGVECSGERAALLRRGCGDALPAAVGLDELDRRARRIWAAGDFLPRKRELGPLSLDLLHRDASAGGRWLALHPREFGLIWRLAEQPGEPVSRARLLRDVWRLDFEPGTNSVEVHVSRLRSKLAAAGLRGLIETHEQGGYRIAPEVAARHFRDQRLCASRELLYG